MNTTNQPDVSRTLKTVIVVFIVVDQTGLSLSQQHTPLSKTWVPPRRDNLELLDLGMGTTTQVKESLADLWRVNRFLNGIGSLTHYLAPRLHSHEGQVTVLDIGAGAAQVAAALAHWGQRRGLKLDVYALDLAVNHLKLGPVFENCPKNLHLLQANAFHLPLKKVDYIVSSLVLHHFAPEPLAALLRSLSKYARHDLIMTDLVRGRLPQVAWLLGTPFFARGAITRHDGMASIRRAYTPTELEAIARDAGLVNVLVQPHLPWRQVLVASTHG